MPQTKNTSSICNYCKNCVGRCSWSHNLTPVTGWVAEKIDYKLVWGDKTGVSYSVKECPQYEEFNEGVVADGK